GDRSRGVACRRRFNHADHHLREYQFAHHHDRGEGRRHDRVRRETLIGFGYIGEADAGRARGGGNMDTIERVNRILVAPTPEWQIIEEERGDLQYLLNNYIAILAGIPALSGLIGFSAIGVVAASGATLRVPVFSGLLGAVFGYLMAFV